jgi:hypothetical protein
MEGKTVQRKPQLMTPNSNRREVQHDFSSREHKRRENAVGAGGIGIENEKKYCQR